VAARSVEEGALTRQLSGGDAKLRERTEVVVAAESTMFLPIGG
jgi:hypothetical protein